MYVGCVCDMWDKWGRLHCVAGMWAHPGHLVEHWGRVGEEQSHVVAHMLGRGRELRGNGC